MYNQQNQQPANHSPGKDLVHLEGRAVFVFRTIKSLSERHPDMTIKELEERGLRAC